MSNAKINLKKDYFRYSSDCTKLKYGQAIYFADAYNIRIIKAKFLSISSDGTVTAKVKGKDITRHKDDIYVKQLGSYPIANFDKHFGNVGLRYFELLLQMHSFDNKTKKINTKDFLLTVHHRLKIDFDRLKLGFEQWLEYYYNDKYSISRTSEIFIIGETNSHSKQVSRTRVYPQYKGSYISDIRILK